jgi:hypothetical protein
LPQTLALQYLPRFWKYYFLLFSALPPLENRLPSSVAVAGKYLAGI